MSTLKVGEIKHESFTGTTQLKLDSAGRLLVGTTTEGHTSGDNLTIAATDGEPCGITLRSDTDEGGRIFFSDGTSGADEYRGVVGYSHATNHMYFSTDASERLRIDSSGRLLLGTTTEGQANADNLTIDGGDAETGITIRSGTSRGNHIYFSDGTSGADEYRGIISYQHSDNKMQFFTDATERMRITSTGNVGIGVTSPVAKLQLDTSHYVVTSSGRSTTGIHLDGTHGNAGEYGGGISFACGGEGSAAIAARQATSSQHRVGMSFFTHDTTTHTDNAVEKVRIHDSGETSFNDGICLGNGLTLSSTNTLDDYETGTWTPDIRVHNNLSTAGQFSYSSRSGTYTKIGRKVHITGFFRISNFYSYTGNLYMFGLPFAPMSSHQPILNFVGDGVNLGGDNQMQMFMIIEGGNNRAVLGHQRNTGWSHLTRSELSGNGGMYVSGSYYV